MNKIVTLFILFLSTTGFYGQSKPIVIGATITLQSQVLSEKRNINIYLPEGYNANDSINYPVIYLLDGSMDEDFVHIVGLVQFCSFEWINYIPKSIVVGIANVDRRRDFSFPTSSLLDKKNNPSSGHSAKFISFIEKELQPLIEKNYKTSESKTLIGQSLGGLLATEILFTKPQLFNTYIIVSPSLWWNNGSIFDWKPEILQEDFLQRTNIYIGVGKEGLTPTEPPRVMEVDAHVLADKIKASKSKVVNVVFDYLPEENHATILHQAVMNVFKRWKQ